MTPAEQVLSQTERDAILRAEVATLAGKGYAVGRVVSAGTIMHAHDGETLSVSVDPFGSVSIRQLPHEAPNSWRASPLGKVPVPVILIIVALVVALAGIVYGPWWSAPVLDNSSFDTNGVYASPLAVIGSLAAIAHAWRLRRQHWLIAVTLITSAIVTVLAIHDWKAMLDDPPYSGNGDIGWGLPVTVVGAAVAVVASAIQLIRAAMRRRVY